MASERALKAATEIQSIIGRIRVDSSAFVSNEEFADIIDRHFPVPQPGKEAEAAAEHIVDETWQGICDAGDPKMRIVPPLRLRVELEACTKAIIAAAYADRIGKYERAVKAGIDALGAHGPCRNNSCRDCKQAWKLLHAALGETT